VTGAEVWHLHLEVFRKKGIEVLLLTETVDSWVVTSLPDFDGKPLQSVAEGIPDFGTPEDEAEQEASEKSSTELADLLGRLKEALGDKVAGVRVSGRLTTYPACIVASEAEGDFFLARQLGGSGLPARPVLEINPQHHLVERLQCDPDDPELADWMHVLYNQAVLTLGARIDDPAAFVDQLNNLLVALTLTSVSRSADPDRRATRPWSSGR
jgi:molecular chaperone HtpG